MKKLKRKRCNSQKNRDEIKPCKNGNVLIFLTNIRLKIELNAYLRLLSVIESLINSPIETLDIVAWFWWIFNYNILVVNLEFFYIFNPFLKFRITRVIKWKIVLLSCVVEYEAFVLRIIVNWVVGKYQEQRGILIDLIIFEFLIRIGFHIIEIVERLNDELFNRWYSEKSFLSVKIIIDWHIFRFLIQKKFLVPHILLTSQNSLIRLNLRLNCQTHKN